MKLTETFWKWTEGKMRVNKRYTGLLENYSEELVKFMAEKLKEGKRVDVFGDIIVPAVTGKLGKKYWYLGKEVKLMIAHYEILNNQLMAMIELADKLESQGRPVIFMGNN